MQSFVVLQQVVVPLVFKELICVLCRRWTNPISTKSLAGNNKLTCRIWGFHRGDYEEFWDMTPCSPLKVNRRFKQTFLLHEYSKQETNTKQVFSRLTSVIGMWVMISVYIRIFRKPPALLVNYFMLDYCLTLKMEAISSPKRKLHDVIFQKIELEYLPLRTMR
jgi:hypothetical protein